MPSLTQAEADRLIAQRIAFGNITFTGCRRVWLPILWCFSSALARLMLWGAGQPDFSLLTIAFELIASLIAMGSLARLINRLEHVLDD